jgi:hypothetical protein
MLNVPIPSLQTPSGLADSTQGMYIPQEIQTDPKLIVGGGMDDLSANLGLGRAYRAPEGRISFGRVFSYLRMCGVDFELQPDLVVQGRWSCGRDCQAVFVLIKYLSTYSSSTLRRVYRNKRSRTQSIFVLRRPREEPYPKLKPPGCKRRCL